jgi:outer membrane protein
MTSQHLCSRSGRASGLLLISFLWTATTLNGAAPPPVLRLSDAVREAVSQSAATSDARDNVTRAESERRLAHSKLTPKFVADAFGSFGQSSLVNQNYGVSFSQQFATGTQIRGNLGALSAQNQLGAFYTSNTSVFVTQPLLRGFGGAPIRRELALADMRTDDARARLRLVEQQTALAMATAYFHIATQSQLVDIADRAVVRARALLEASEAKLNIGKVSQLDVLRARQLLVQTELQALDARTAVEDAKDQVRLLLQRDASFDFSVDSTLPPSPEAVSLDEAMKLAEERRVELQDARTAVRQSQMALAAVTDQGRPQIDVTLALTRNTVANTLPDAFGLDRFQAATFAGVSFPFDRTPIDTARQGAAIQLARQERELDLTKLRIAQEVRSAHRDQIRLARTVEQADAAVGFAEQEVDLATLRFQRGLSNNLDLVTAEGNLLGARARRFAALGDLAVARLRLKLATGTLDPVADFR